MRQRVPLSLAGVRYFHHTLIFHYPRVGKKLSWEQLDRRWFHQTRAPDHGPQTGHAHSWWYCQSHQADKVKTWTIHTRDSTPRNVILLLLMKSSAGNNASWLTFVMLLSLRFKLQVSLEQHRIMKTFLTCNWGAVLFTWKMAYLSATWDTCQVLCKPFCLWHATKVYCADELRPGCTSAFKWLSCHSFGKCCPKSYRREWRGLLHQEAFVIIQGMHSLSWLFWCKGEACALLLLLPSCSSKADWIKRAWRSSCSLLSFGGAHSIWAPSCGSPQTYQRRTRQAQLGARGPRSSSPALLGGPGKDGAPLCTPLPLRREGYAAV